MQPTSSEAPTCDPDAVPRPIRLLVVEDSELDYELLLRSLRRQGLEPDPVRVETGPALEAALAAGPWDAVISDHHLPSFSSGEALRIVRASGLNLPFIIVSGTIGEDAAVAAMQAGADDYLVKGRLARLGPALRNAMSAAAARRERALARAALAESERRLRALTDHLQQAVEAERAAIARDVHDDVGGMLTALRFDIAWIERHGDDAVRARARQGLDTLNQAVFAVQRIMRDLRPPALEAGIVEALDVLVQQFRSRTGIPTQLTHNRERVELSEQVAITVYRVAQESLTNVAKHARATRARVDLFVRDDTLSLEVSDDGVGLRAEDVDKPGSFGLRGLVERVRQVGGWLDVAVGEPRGAVMLTIPLTEAAQARLVEETGG
ncbi:MAG TPA: response regulator [Burkholderiaceae bacterium]|nr:response regulator [Burkholderiaceae bacterium]